MVGVTVQELRCFVLVARVLSFTDSAARLGITQPGLSMAIRQLESKLGGPLFDRTTRSVRLSPVGAALLPSAERLVESFDRTVSGMVEISEGRQGRLTIACPEGVAAHLLAPVIKEFVEENPGVVVSVFDGDAASVENLMHSLVADFGLTGFWKPHPDFHFEPLTTDRACVICSTDHPFAARQSIAVEELHGVPIVALNRDAGIRRLIEATCAALGLSLTVQFEVARVSTLIEIVASGLCISVLTELSRPHHSGKHITAVPLDGPGLHYPVGIITPARRMLTASAARFLQAVRQRHGTDKLACLGAAGHSENRMAVRPSLSA